MPELTIELWARPASPAGARNILTSADGAVALRVTATTTDMVTFSISISDGGGPGPGGPPTTRTVTSDPVPQGAWHHVIVSLRQPTLRLWVDGKRTEVGNVQLAAPLALDALRLGGDAGTAYEGALDEIWVAQTAITTDDAALARYCPL
jgi:hypothetical protein